MTRPTLPLAVVRQRLAGVQARIEGVTTAAFAKMAADLPGQETLLEQLRDTFLAEVSAMCNTTAETIYKRSKET